MDWLPVGQPGAAGMRPVALYKRKGLNLINGRW